MFPLQSTSAARVRKTRRLFENPRGKRNTRRLQRRQNQSSIISDASELPPDGMVLFGRYTIYPPDEGGKQISDCIIGKGKFGIIFKAYDNITGEPVAIKREVNKDAEGGIRKNGAPESKNKLSIKHETKIMTYLFQNRFRKLPYVHWYGSQDIYQYLVMTYYKYSLEHFWNISEKTPYIFGIIFSKCIRILESIHKLYVLHRDIKPDNFMIKLGNFVSDGEQSPDFEVHLIDYGLSTFWINCGGDAKNWKHIPNIKQETITGTPKFVSYYNHIGNTISRRDDLMSLGYMFMYFMYGYLPWSISTPLSDGFLAKSKSAVLDFLENETANIMYSEGQSPDNLLAKQQMRYNAHRSSAPTAFLRMHPRQRRSRISSYMEYCYNLEFDETPNYSMISEIFSTSIDL